MEHLPDELIERGKSLASEIALLPVEKQIEVLNQIRAALHEASPFKAHPVDLVLWVKPETVEANDYNPNVVAPPEFKLLKRSVEADGYTQPVVTSRRSTDHKLDVVDGAHRRRLPLEFDDIHAQVHGYLPVTIIREDRTAREDRIAATMRHNLARGKHTIAGEREIVLELVRRNWSDARIAKELGMDADKVLRLKQISGLADMFAEQGFSEAWEVSP